MVLHDDGRCPLAILLPFTERGIKQSKERDIQGAFTHMASALMAMEDFNKRDHFVAKQLAEDEFQLDDGECTVYFPLPWDINDDEDDVGMQKFVSVIKDDGGREDMTANAILSTLSQMHRSEFGVDARKNHGLCALAGTTLSSPARTAATLAAASDIPYFSHAADTTKISRPPIYPLAGKTSADEYDRGDAIISYLSSLGRDKVVLAYTLTNEDVLKVTSRAAKEHGVELRYEPFGPPMDGKSSNTPYDAMRRIKESGFKTVILEVTRMSHLEGIAREAERWGVNTDEYVWFIYDTAIDFQVLANVKTYPGSEIDKLLSGMGSVRVLDGYDWQGKDNKFLASWKSRDAVFVEKLNAINPIKDKKEMKEKGQEGRDLQKKAPPGGGGAGAVTPGYFHADPDYFQKYPPMPFSSYMYDTVIALGMGACRAQRIMRQVQTSSANNNKVEISEAGGTVSKPDSDASYIEVTGDGSTRSRELQGGSYLSKPGPNLQYNETVKVTFDGASGFVKLDNGMIFTRDPETIGFGTFNIRPVTGDLPSLQGGDSPQEIKRSYKYALTAMRVPGGQWAETNEPFIYSDGTTTQPQPVREVFENNYLSPEMRAAGFSLFAIGAFICIGLAGWTFVKRKSTIVRAAQPEFLYLLCFGSFQSLIAIIMLSFDESCGTSVDTLSRMCTATPWLFFTGYIIVYMIIFSKLRRINSVLQFRRRQVKVHQVMLPAILLILLALIVLALWTALDPWVWVRETVDEITGETFGKCQSDNGTAYVVPLAVLMIAATLLAAGMTYKTRDIDSRFSETNSMFFAIVTQLETWLVGIPILVIVDNVSADATYLGRVLLIWTFAVTMVLTVLGSKFATSVGLCAGSNQTRYVGGSGVHLTGGENRPKSHNSAPRDHTRPSDEVQTSGKSACTTIRTTMTTPQKNPDSPQKIDAEGPIMEHEPGSEAHATSNSSREDDV